MNEITNKFELLLSSIDIFKGLDKEAIQDISRRFQIERFQEGEKLIESGQQASSLYIIFNGNVELQTPNLLGHLKRQVNLFPGRV